MRNLIRNLRVAVVTSLMAAAVTVGCGEAANPLPTVPTESSGAILTAPNTKRNSGYYDDKMIAYTQATVTVGSPAEAQRQANGNVVFHIVGNSTTPTQPGTGGPGIPDAPQVQCAPLGGHLPPAMASNCNVLNAIPTDIGYHGGMWHLEVFTWNEGANVRALMKDDEVLDAVANGEGTLNVDLPVLIQCPVNDFSLLR
jgi:hypothetical protein